MRAVHGGEVRAAAARFGRAVELDFSANLNPRGLPERARAWLRAASAESLIGYPDRDGWPLRGRLAERLGVPEECVVVGEGAEALLGAALRALRPETVWTPAPGFSEYRRAVEACGARVRPYALRAEDGFVLREALGAGLAIVNNSHNPSGALLERTRMKELCGRAEAIVDEAFIDFVPEASVAGLAAAREGLVVLRSLTKFYGCAGLRVGYAVCGRATAEQVRAQLPAWPVGTWALGALSEAVLDEEYAVATRAETARRRAALAQGLRGLGAWVGEGVANYVLAQHGRAETCERLMAEFGLLARDCASYEGLDAGWTRFAVRTDEENARLLAALEEIWRLR